MKRIFFLSFCILLTILTASCSMKNSTSSQVIDTTPMPTAPSTKVVTQQQFSFTKQVKVNSSTSAFTVTISGTEKKYDDNHIGYQASQISVFNSNGTKLQTITPTANEAPTADMGFSIADINFDGNNDFTFVSTYGSNGNRNCFGYTWDSGAKKFVLSPDFNQIGCPCVDKSRKLILGLGVVSSKTYGYSIFAYSGGKYVMENSLTIDSFASSTPNVWKVTESKLSNGSWTSVANFQINYTSTKLPKTDSKLAPYFAAGSLWSIDCNSWQKLYN
ncbi:MAG: hypothetical protein Q8876_08975 [Bacillota bacterium]|nr:hypothetical protein [Bacillota bacterium]